MSLLVWTTKSTRNLANALTSTGHPVSDGTVARMLRGLGFSLQGNANVIEGHRHADRDAQFRYLATQADEHAQPARQAVATPCAISSRPLIVAAGAATLEGVVGDATTAIGR